MIRQAGYCIGLFALCGCQCGLRVVQDCSASVCVTDSGAAGADGGSALTISPRLKTLAVENIFTFTATGGIPPLAFAIASGGGTVGTASGLYVAPATPGTSLLQVTDAVGNSATATVHVNEALAISPATKTLQAEASVAFSATGGVSPYEFSVLTGGGAIIATTGRFKASSASGPATVRVIDAVGNVSDASVTVVPALVISPAAKALAVGNAFAFSAIGGVNPYTFSVLSGQGAVTTTGLYTASAAAGAAVVRVVDAIGNSSDANVTVNPALQIAPATKTLAVLNSSTFTASGGVGPYAFSISVGGGSIGEATGIYVAPGIAGAASVKVHDSLGNTSTANVIVNPALTINPMTKTIGVGSNLAFSAAGGVTPYTFSTLSGVGGVDAVSGVYRSADAGTAVVRVTDTGGNTSDANTVAVDRFAPAVKYAVESSPAAMTAGDWNGDGKADLAVGNAGGPSISILLGVGDGTFQAAVNYTVGLAPMSITTGDWNGDGKADLAAVSHAYDSVSILLGVGNGTFQSAVSFFTGNNPEAVVTGDWNADGKSDLAVARPYYVAILRGNGNGTFQAPVEFSTTAYPASMTTGDWNGDGKSDLAVTSDGGGSRVNILLGVGDGTFQPPVSYNAGMYPICVTSADLNGDSKADLAIVGYYSSYISVLFGVGNGTFQPEVNVGAPVHGYSLVAGDWDGDGKLDLLSAIASQTGGAHSRVGLLLGVGNGTFLPAVNYDVGMGPRAMIGGDWNGDGKADLAAANLDGANVSILLNVAP